MRESALRFLDRQLTPQDAVAVLAYDQGLELLVDFSSDPGELSRVLGGLSQRDRESDVSLPDEDSDAAAGGEFLADETEFALFESNHQLSAIQAIADAFRDVPGRKALVYFSAGLTSRGIENDDQLRWTADLCNRANISIYSVDARGLVALSPGGGAHRSGGGQGIFTGRADLNQLVRLSQSREGLITLAADTGGAVLLDDNDLGKIFRKAQEDSSHYYLLGYYAPRPTPRRPVPQGRGHRQPARAPPRLPAGLLCGQTLRRLEQSRKGIQAAPDRPGGRPQGRIPRRDLGGILPRLRGRVPGSRPGGLRPHRIPVLQRIRAAQPGSDHPGPRPEGRGPRRAPGPGGNPPAQRGGEGHPLRLPEPPGSWDPAGTCSGCCSGTTGPGCCPRWTTGWTFRPAERYSPAHSCWPASWKNRRLSPATGSRRASRWPRSPIPWKSEPGFLFPGSGAVSTGTRPSTCTARWKPPITPAVNTGS